MRPISRSEQMQKLAEAYLAYRLNRNELADLVTESQAGNSVDQKFESYTDRKVDWKDQRAGSELDGLVDQLGLQEQLEQLDEDQVWTPFERALHRKLTDNVASETPLGPQAPVALNSLFQETVEQNFDTWDRNVKGRITAQGLDFIMAGGFFDEWRTVADTPRTAAALAVLRQYGSRLSNADPYDGKGLTQKDLRILAERGVAGDPGIVGLVNDTFTDYLAQGMSLSVRKAIDEEMISPANIHQGVPGSCVMLSTLAGQSAHELERMIEEDADGNFTVTFGDGSTETVAEPTLAERFYHAKGAEGDRWLAILEKALGQRLYREKEDRPEVRSIRLAIDGIEPETALKSVTGLESVKVSLDESTLNETRAHLSQMTGRDEPVICGSRPEALSDFISIEELHNGIINSHAYAVKGYNSETDMVTLQNPWHKGEWSQATDGVDDGVFEMPARDFYCSFRWIATTKDQSAAA